MSDCFALLDEPRRPWLEPDALKRKFLAIAVHPDRVHQASTAEQRAAQQRYAELNSAYQRLREPKERLQHLLELELGAKPQPIQNIPPDLTKLFLEVGRLCRQADAFLSEKEGATSPLLQVGLFELGQERTAELMALQRQINCRYEALVAELKMIDADWPPDEAGAEVARRRALLPKLEELYRLFSYVARWSAQIQERVVRISL